MRNLDWRREFAPFGHVANCRFWKRRQVGDLPRGDYFNVLDRHGLPPLNVSREARNKKGRTHPQFGFVHPTDMTTAFL
jgi:hypothetical protein